MSSRLAHWAALAALLACLPACAQRSTAGADENGYDAPGAGGSHGGGEPGAPDPDEPEPMSPMSPMTPAPTSGSLALSLTADKAAASDALVSLGVPFPPGAITDPSLIRVLDADGVEVASYSKSLATWPGDGSQRSIFVAFKTTLAKNAKASFEVVYGGPRTKTSDELAPNPDGPVSALLDAAWYASSRVIGHQVAAAANERFSDWEAQMESAIDDMSPSWESYDNICNSDDRAYYDSVHALYTRAARHATPATYRRAREEAEWYRANEIAWYDNHEVATLPCDGWDEDTPLTQRTIRRMYPQGMLDDYLLTGDDEAHETLVGLGEAFRRNLPALTSPAGANMPLKKTERNLGWTLMGLAGYYAVNHGAEVKSAVDELVGIAESWQAEGSSGAFEHDIMKADSEECGDGPDGGSPFMTSLLVDGLMEAYFLTADPRIPPVVLATATWLEGDAQTKNGKAFQYLWGCEDNGFDYPNDPIYADLNVLIAHVFGAAYLLSGDEGWLTFGDVMADHGIDAMYLGNPKHWNQAGRAFPKYMGYRALALSP